MTFASTLLVWYEKHGRDLPWRTTRDPYKILVSEIMLQQTQVDRVIPKYEAWLAAFPDWEALAAAPRAEVLNLWSGLGYNNRAVRLHALAKFVVEHLSNTLPQNEEALVKLPGIGPYTAGAIMAFAHNQPGKCIDVNIERIVKRVVFSKKKVITKKEIEKEFLNLYPADATAFANAMMDFGSMICTASTPKCDTCPMFAICKSKGERPEERQERKKKRQPKFEGSNRWWRGQILKAINTGKESEEAIFAAIDGEEKAAFKKALSQLQDEGLVSRSRRILINE
jgi:A/G-specific adenine glycosylase